MPFFARPNLDNEQFKQLSGTKLTLSGQTQIATITGFTLTDGAGGNVIITASGSSSGTTGYVMAQDVDGVIKLMPSAASGASTYYGSSPTTCAVGGLSAGTTIYGMPIQDILEEILAPTLSPTKIEPSSTFTISCLPLTSTGYYEIGSSICVTSNSTFNRGSVVPVYCGGPSVRSGLACAYCYTYCGGDTCVSSTASANTYTFASHSIGANETYTGKVFYSSGQTILNSSGGAALFTTACTCNPLPAGSTPNITRTINATYPYFYGKLTGSTRPAVTNALVISGNKVVYPSTGTVTVSFNSNTNEYTWIAIPTICGTPKKCWYVNALDNGFMNRGCVSDKYPDECVFCVTCGSWCINYMVYMSGTVGQITNPMEFRNS